MDHLPLRDVGPICRMPLVGGCKWARDQSLSPGPDRGVEFDTTAERIVCHGGRGKQVRFPTALCVHEQLILRACLSWSTRGGYADVREHWPRCGLPPLFDGRAIGAPDRLGCRLKSANTAARRSLQGARLGGLSLCYRQKLGMLSRMSAKKILLVAACALGPMPRAGAVGDRPRRQEAGRTLGVFRGKVERVKHPKRRLIRELLWEIGNHHHKEACLATLTFRPVTTMNEFFHLLNALFVCADLKGPLALEVRR